jgi:hypothetical protein
MIVFQAAAIESLESATARAFSIALMHRLVEVYARLYIDCRGDVVIYPAMRNLRVSGILTDKAVRRGMKSDWYVALTVMSINDGRQHARPATKRA